MTPYVAARKSSTRSSTWPTPSSRYVASSARRGPHTGWMAGRHDDHDHAPIRASS